MTCPRPDAPSRDTPPRGSTTSSSRDAVRPSSWKDPIQPREAGLFAKITIARALVASAVAFTTVAAHASTVPMTVAGNWMAPETAQNLLIRARAHLGGVDGDPRPTAGSYGLSDLSFQFERLSTFNSPFTLRADPGRSNMHIYARSPGEGVGEVRFFGGMDRTLLMPNGSEAIDFDLRLYFSEVPNDTPGSLLQVGALPPEEAPFSSQTTKLGPSKATGAAHTRYQEHLLRHDSPCSRPYRSTIHKRWDEHALAAQPNRTLSSNFEAGTGPQPSCRAHGRPQTGDLPGSLPRAESIPREAHGSENKNVCSAYVIPRPSVGPHIVSHQ